MIRVILAAAIGMLFAQAPLAQEAAGSLTLIIDGRERPFALVQGADGANPGSRYSQLGEDLVMTVVGVLGADPHAPGDAEETIELKFTIDGSASEVRPGSVISHSTRDDEGRPTTRSGTAELAIDTLEAGDQGVVASGTFTADLPPDHESAGTQIAGDFRTEMRPRE